MTSGADTSPEKLAAWVRLNTSQRIQPPVNVVGLATEFGASVVPDSSKDSPIGRTSDERGRRVIYYRLEHDQDPSLVTVRQRFTIAHELGHHLLSTRLGLTLEKQVNKPTLESYCDRFASSILMPRNWVQERWGSVSPTLAHLRDVSRSADVSMHAAAIALREYAGWERAFLQWQWYDSKWRLRTKVMSSLLVHDVTSSNSTSDQLSTVSREQDSEIDLPLKVGGQTVTVGAEVRRGKTTWAIISEEQLSVSWHRSLRERAVGRAPSAWSSQRAGSGQGMSI